MIDTGYNAFIIKLVIQHKHFNKKGVADESMVIYFKNSQCHMQLCSQQPTGVEYLDS